MTEENQSLIEISGGLGNQLFQLALGLSRFGQPGHDFRFISPSQEISRWSRKIEIGAFLPKGTILDSRTIPRLRSHLSLSRDNLLQVKNISQKYSDKTIIEKVLLHDASVLFPVGHFFKGSFIHPAYWNQDSKKLFSKLESLIPIPKIGKTRANSPFNNLGIHIRRGDYVKNSKSLKFHGLCSNDYYFEALDCINDISDYSLVTIFSDDRKVAERFARKLKGRHPKIVIDSSRTGFELLSRMSTCKALIGCNSTISWWAAFLGIEKIRIFPEKWFVNESVTLDPVQTFFPSQTLLTPNKLITFDDI